jgi:5-methylcytosine-specific restriction endonuclease McrA
MFDKKAYMKEYNDEYRRVNRDRILQGKKDYYYSNREKCLADCKAYRIKNADRKKQNDKRWREENRERKAENDRNYRINNRERCNEVHRRYSRTIKGRLGAKKRAAVRRSLMKGLSTKVVQMVYEDNIKRYGTLTCYLCLSPIEFRKDHLEHKTPISRGGNNEYNNLGVSCQFCNLSKHDMTEQEFMDAKCQK